MEIFIRNGIKDIKIVKCKDLQEYYFIAKHTFGKNGDCIDYTHRLTQDVELHTDIAYMRHIMKYIDDPSVKIELFTIKDVK